ncbi:MAG: rRNA maturation RNase YbeY, partial [Pseudomonadota bacterium]
MSAGELAVDVQFATRRPWVPSAARVAEWARAAAGRAGRGAELSVRVVGPRESRTLNRTWRGKDKPTNVLSFPGSETGSQPSSGPTQRLAGPSSLHLGDLAICASVV